MVGLVKTVKPPKLPSETTIANASDTDDVISFLIALRREIEDGEVEPDLLETLVTSIVKENNGVAFIIRGERGIEASIGIGFERRPLAWSYRLRVVWSLVAPRFRDSTGHGIGLIRAAVKFADALGRPLLLSASMHKPQKIILRQTFEASPRVRLYSRQLSTAGLIFAHFPGGDLKKDEDPQKRWSLGARHFAG